jgi:RNA recognition motif-containing protein
MQRTLFVANFPETVDSDDLENLFTPYGRVLSARVWWDLETGESRGFGFVEMQDENDADRAIDDLDGHWWRGRRLRVSPARPKRS